MHLILPFAPRVKQPVLHFTHALTHKAFHQVVVAKLQHRPHWSVELDRFQLAAGGDERSVPNILESFLFSFMLGLHSGGGKQCVV